MMSKGTSWIHSDHGASLEDTPLIEHGFECFIFESDSSYLLFPANHLMLPGQTKPEHSPPFLSIFIICIVVMMNMIVSRYMKMTENVIFPLLHVVELKIITISEMLW